MTGVADFVADFGPVGWTARRRRPIRRQEHQHGAAGSRRNHRSSRRRHGPATAGRVSPWRRRRPAAETAAGAPAAVSGAAAVRMPRVGRAPPPGTTTDGHTRGPGRLPHPSRGRQRTRCHTAAASARVCRIGRRWVSATAREADVRSKDLLYEMRRR